jgi:glycosyl transferase family 87
MTISVKLGAVAAFWLAVGLVQIFNWEGGAAKAAVMLVLLLAIPFIIAAARGNPPPLDPRLARAIDIAAVIVLIVDIAYLLARIAHPHLIDVPLTTLAAIDAVLHGQNPYALALDTGPETMGFAGYKYLPVTIFVYLPLGAAFGQRGVLLTNLALLLGCLWLMRRLARSNLAPLLFIMLPIMVQQIFAKGATDLVTVLPLLGAFALSERSAFLSGLCVGLSIAAKPIPGGLFAVSLVPAEHRWRYAAGIAVGMLPILPFFIASPRDLVANTILFNLARIPDATSWLYGASPATLLAAKLVLIALILGAVVYVWRQRPPLAARCGLGPALTLAAILCGPGAHHNYQLWWLPFYAVTLSLALAPGKACQAEAARYTSAAKMDARGS